ncbi:hypothetical protein TOREUM_20668 [Tenacibaculum litoreum]|uniref:hypothetical protein n=1 Tax=Tenacibaculum litoreum TaxID=321269 RepID=UPI0038966F3B
MKKFKILTGNGYDWETFIYIMNGNGESKFGITNNIERRLKQYEIERPLLKLKYCKPLSNRNVARLIEYQMKNHFPIIAGLETTNAPLNQLIDFIESSKDKLEDLILELPEHLIEKNIAFDNLMTKIENSKPTKSYSFMEKREKNSNTYTKWEKEDDEKLELLFCEGKNIKELSLIFGRNNGAIRSRIKKLELKEKYCG